MGSDRRRARRWLAGTLLACACAGSAAASVLIFGEQHDQRDQQRQVAESVAALAAESRLAALVLEMAERPQTTSGLPRDTDEVRVREALQWRGWPWPAYAAVVMGAVRAGAPVYGGNLPRAKLREAMGDATLDDAVPAAARAKLAEAVRVGHCDLLPASQLPGLVRMQIARDRSMAEVVASASQAAKPGQVVVLLTGAQHASRDRGVPLHLGGAELRVVMFGSPEETSLVADEHWRAQHTPEPDHCESLRQQLAAPAAAPASASAP